MDWHAVISKALWGFILGGVGGLVGGVVLALMTPPKDEPFLWTAFSTFLSAAVGGAVEESLREILRQKKVLAP